MNRLKGKSFAFVRLGEKASFCLLGKTRGNRAETAEK